MLDRRPTTAVDDGKENALRRMSQASVSKSYVDTLEKRQVLARRATNESLRLKPRLGDSSHGKMNVKNQRQSRLGIPKDVARSGLATEHLQEQLEAYDERLSLLRSQLRDSVDQKLRSSVEMKKDDTRIEDSPAVKESIVQGLVTASGQGCKEVLQGSVAAKKGSKSGHVWKSRSPKGTQLKSSCTLKLESRKSCNVTIKITFAGGESVPGTLLFEHAPKATAAFKPLGKVSLQKKSLKQLKHVFHLGNDVIVDRYLRVSCMGQIGDSRNLFHAVSYLFISGHAADPEDDLSEDEAQDVKDDAVEVHVSLDNFSPPKTVQAHVKPRRRASPNVWERLSGKETVANREEKVVVKETVAHTRVLDTDRIRFVEDALRGLGMTGSDAAELVKNIVFGNESSIFNRISQDQVDELVTCLPTKEERRQLRLLDPAKIDNEAEDFMHEIMSIDNLTAKIETKWFLADFDARAAVVQDAANLISRACNEIHQCSKLHLAIKLILSECSESLKGAKVLDVNLLKELKNTHYSSKGSLLHFVAAKMSEASGSMKVPNIAKDLPTCSPASQVTLSDIKCELKQLTDGIEEAGTAWRADEPAAGVIEKRINTALTKLSSTEAIVTETEADFLESAIDSGLDPSSIDDSKDLFLSILAFSDELNNAHLENKCVGFLTKSKEGQNTDHYAESESEQQTSVCEPINVPMDDATHEVADEGHKEVVAAATPVSSRVSVDQLLQSAKKTIQTREDSPAPNEPSVESGSTSSDPDDISTPVRKLLQSSRAILESFDMKTLESSPYKYDHVEATMPRVEESDADGLCEISSPPAHVLQSEAGFGSEAEVVSHASEVEQDEKNTQHDLNMHMEEKIQSVDPAEKSMDKPVQKVELKSTADKSDTKATREESVPSESGESGSSRKSLADSIDLSLAAKLLKNAEQVKMSRSQQSLQKSTRRRSSHLHSGEKRQPSTSRSRTSRLSLAGPKRSQNLTPEQAKAVKALGEVIRQSLPKFSSAEADRQSGLHLDTQNLDLDKILSTIILNSGNTPTGPLARGVRGGNVSIFDGEEANELRQSEKERHCGIQNGRKALLEPVIPAPLCMGVTVSKTVSEGISPETIARSLHSGMGTTSIRDSSSRSGKGSVHQRVPEQPRLPGQEQAPPKAIGHGSLHDSAPWKKSQENVNQNKVSQVQQPSAQLWNDSPQIDANAGMYEQRHPSPIAEEGFIDTPPHGLDFGGEHSDLDGLSPMGLRTTREDALKSSRDNAAMAADRMQLWGYNM